MVKTMLKTMIMKTKLDQRLFGCDKPINALLSDECFIIKYMPTFHSYLHLKSMLTRDQHKRQFISTINKASVQETKPTFNFLLKN